MMVHSNFRDVFWAAVEQMDDEQARKSKSLFWPSDRGNPAIEQVLRWMQRDNKFGGFFVEVKPHPDTSFSIEPKQLTDLVKRFQFYVEALLKRTIEE